MFYFQVKFNMFTAQLVSFLLNWLLLLCFMYLLLHQCITLLIFYQFVVKQCWLPLRCLSFCLFTILTVSVLFQVHLSLCLPAPTPFRMKKDCSVIWIHFNASTWPEKKFQTPWFAFQRLIWSIIFFSIYSQNFPLCLLFLPNSPQLTVTVCFLRTLKMYKLSCPLALPEVKFLISLPTPSSVTCLSQTLPPLPGGRQWGGPGCQGVSPTCRA